MTNDLKFDIKFEPAYDNLADGGGVHGCNMQFTVNGDKGAVSFVLYTNWQLPEVDARNPTQPAVMYKPMPADLGYHSYTPMYEGHEPMGKYKYRVIPASEDGAGEYESIDTGSFTPCELLDGAKCYYDGSSLNAENVYEVLVREGYDGVEKVLKNYYGGVFNGDDYTLPESFRQKKLREEVNTVAARRVEQIQQSNPVFFPAPDALGLKPPEAGEIPDVAEWVVGSERPDLDTPITVGEVIRQARSEDQDLWNVVPPVLGGGGVVDEQVEPSDEPLPVVPVPRGLIAQYTDEELGIENQTLVEFTNAELDELLAPPPTPVISPQRKWRLKMIDEGKCTNCGKEKEEYALTKKCDSCAMIVRESMREQRGSVRRYPNAKSYRSSQ